MSGGASVAMRLRERGAEAWREAVTHPMVTALGEGTLDVGTFRYYLGQNVLYLEEYARAIARAVALTDDLEGLSVLSRFLRQIVEVEIPANLTFLARAGGAPLEGGSAAMTPTTYAYTRHLLACCERGPLALALAALLPCQWSYGEIATRLATRTPDEPLYSDWIAMFANPTYVELVNASNAQLDRSARRADEAELSSIFDRSTRYEADFWQMAYTRDGALADPSNPPMKESPHVR